jgi:hypothetical protein
MIKLYFHFVKGLSVLLLFHYVLDLFIFDYNIIYKFVYHIINSSLLQI